MKVSFLPTLLLFFKFVLWIGLPEWILFLGKCWLSRAIRSSFCFVFLQISEWEYYSEKYSRVGGARVVDWRPGTKRDPRRIRTSFLWLGQTSLRHLSHKWLFYLCISFWSKWATSGYSMNRVSHRGAPCNITSTTFLRKRENRNIMGDIWRGVKGTLYVSQICDLTEKGSLFPSFPRRVYKKELSMWNLLLIITCNFRRPSHFLVCGFQLRNSCPFHWL